MTLKSLRSNFKLAEEVSVYTLTLLTSIFFVAACNSSFWSGLIKATGGLRLENFHVLAAAFIILVIVFNAGLTLVAFRPFLKPVLIFLFLATSVAVYFMNRYGIMIDAGMIQNAYETDTYETKDLLHWHLAAVVLLLGVLPSFIVWRAKVRYRPVRHDLLIKSKIILISATVVVGIAMICFKQFAPTLREHRGLRFMLTPTNYLQATHSYLKSRYKKPMAAVSPIGTDAVRGEAWKNQIRRTVTVIVVGETARAMNFSLNGYSRNTNPELAAQAGLVNFSNVQSCGTATAVSVPCVFSALGRQQYEDGAAKSQENLLDVLSHAGFNVVWRDNNSGCKGVCSRVAFEDMSRPAADEPLCNSDECYDERLLRGLPELIRSSDRDMVIVLHQKGSHGPAYWKRYPREFERFGSVCETSDLQKCSTESIVNSYDNTILYTDHFLSSTIDLLRKSASKDGVDASLVYFSDHGESLGEKNMYLHGAPYFISPIEQRHVPFMLWFSDGFRSRFRIDANCLGARSEQPFSHDNVFHSILGMLNINTAIYNPALDLFRTCSRGV